MGKFRFFVFIFSGLFLLLGFFLGLQRVQAAETPSQEVVINEVMWMGSSASSTDEWIELRNMTNGDIDLSGWQIDNGGPGNSPLIVPEDGEHIIPANGFYLISRYSIADNVPDPLHPKTILDVIVDWRVLGMANISLANSSNGNLILKDTIGNIIDEAKGDSWPAGDGTKKYSMERNDLTGDGLLAENWHTALDSVGFVSGATEKGTPGSENSEIINQRPTAPILRSPENGSNLNEGSEVSFSWLESLDPEGQAITYDFYVSCSNNFEDKKFVDTGIEETNYLINIDNILEDYGNCETYYWKIVAFDDFFETESTVFSFTISKIVYSNDIIINELFADPSSNSSSEWIELYNSSAVNVDLKDWSLEDLKGSIHRYTVKDSLIISANSYLLIERSKSGITLNNDADGARLIRPDGQVLYETPIFSGGRKDWAFARNSSGQWQWTTKPTAAKLNSIVVPVVEEDESVDETQEDEIKIPVNSEPMEIKTGDFKNWENYLVKVRGEIVDTSGNTFYIDDGSGRAKIYIQAATGIDKPEMHKGDIFEVIGIVNLYRETWRVLPQDQDDIKLIQAVQEATETTSTAVKKASTASTAKKTTSSTASTSKPKSPSAKVASASNQNPSANSDTSQVAGYKSPLWIQFVKTLTGLSVILLLLLGVRFLQIRKSRDLGGPLGGNFGDYT